MNGELRRLARRYRNGEEMEKLGYSALSRYEGVCGKLRALNDAKALGITKDELLAEVAQIDIEEEDVK